MTTQATQSNNALGRRSLPSSFFAPLQTLGRYIDRGKNDCPDPDVSSSPGTSSPGTSSPRTSSEDQLVEGNRPDSQISPERQLDGGVREQSSWQVGNGGPDPDSVRKAISRLAQGAQGQQPQNASNTAAFAEVARRVWSGASPELPPPHLVQQEDEGWEDEGQKDEGQKDERQQDRAWAATTSAVASAAHSAVALHLQTRDVPAFLGTGTGTEANANADTNASNPIADPITDPIADPGTNMYPGPDSAEAHALAHDAGNLLSALRLYSELLCFSGVLHERHRHYAEDLKLLSLRSERLIDRLVQLAEQVAPAERADVAPPVPMSLVNLPPGAPVKLSFNEASVWARNACPVPERSGPELVEADAVGGRDVVLSGPSLAGVLTTLRGLLGTIAHGALVVDLGPWAGLPVDAPVEALERVLVNLVSNAAAAVSDGGAIRIRAGVVAGPDAAGPDAARPDGLDASCGPLIDSTVVLTVDDSGCGMSEAQVRSALGRQTHGVSGQPPFGPDASVPLRDRHGLGLSIVRGLVQANGGKLFIHSRPGTGTRIEVHWRTAAVQESAAAQDSAAAHQVQVRSSASPRRVSMRSGASSTCGELQQPGLAQSVQGAVA
jgi:signal transduction histidine kinase